MNSSAHDHQTSAEPPPSWRRRTGVAIALLALVGVALVAAIVARGSPDAPAEPTLPYSLTRLSPRVIVLDCLEVNVTAIASDSGIVVVDTHRSPGSMRQLREVIEREFGRSDFACLIHTHGDPDHIAGSGAFPSVPLVAHEDYAAYVAHAKAATLRSRRTSWIRLEEARARYGALDPGSEEAIALRRRIVELELLQPDPRGGPAPRMPEITFRDSLTLDLGDLTLDLRFVGEAHTDHDILVHVPEERLLLTGDLICSPRSPCFRVHAMADVPRLVEQLEGVLRRDPALERIVPGHGEPLTRDDLITFCRALTERYGRVAVDRSAARALRRAIEEEGLEAALQRFGALTPEERGEWDWSEDELGTLGERLTRCGRTAEAVGILTLAARLLPRSSFLHGCLGDARLEAGDTEGAIEAYGRSLALMPENRHAAEMLEILR